MAGCRKRCRIEPCLLWQANRKSHTCFRFVLNSMTLDDLEWLIRKMRYMSKFSAVSRGSTIARLQWRNFKFQAPVKIIRVRAPSSLITYRRTLVSKMFIWELGHRKRRYEMETLRALREEGYIMGRECPHSPDASPQPTNGLGERPKLPQLKLERTYLLAINVAFLRRYL